MDVSNIVADIRSKFKPFIDKIQPGMDMTKACLWWSAFTVDHLKKLGIPALIQAGSMSYKFMPDELDDGVSSTHFSYVWERSEQTMRLIIQGRMPEMHVWVVAFPKPRPPQLIDLTTCYLQHNFKEAMPTQTWRTPTPPDYIWCVPEKLPPEAYYHPDRDAITLALAMVSNTPLRWGIMPNIANAARRHLDR